MTAVSVTTNGVVVRTIGVILTMTALVLTTTAVIDTITAVRFKDIGVIVRMTAVMFKMTGVIVKITAVTRYASAFGVAAPVFLYREGVLPLPRSWSARTPFPIRSQRVRYKVARSGS
jgi:hypothetical protein